MSELIEREEYVLGTSPQPLPAVQYVTVLRKNVHDNLTYDVYGEAKLSSLFIIGRHVCTIALKCSVSNKSTTSSQQIHNRSNKWSSSFSAGI